jgi:1-acyl-sn-glycerol-3-phosphate acyltransferase
VLWGLWLSFWLIIATWITGWSVIFASYLHPRGRTVEHMTHWWGRTILRMMRVPVEVVGREHLQPDQAYVYASNHRSSFDIFVLISELPGKFLWVAKQSLFRIPVFGWALHRMGSVPVDRSNLQTAVKSLNRAAAIVKSGVSMIIFPEGTRGTTAELLPFKKGVFVMAIKAGQPIVPVSISGTSAIQPPGSFRVRPGPIRVVIAPPISPQDFRRKEDLMDAVRQAIAANYDPDFPPGSGGQNG